MYVVDMRLPTYRHPIRSDWDEPTDRPTHGEISCLPGGCNVSRIPPTTIRKWTEQPDTSSQWAFCANRNCATQRPL